MLLYTKRNQSVDKSNSYLLYISTLPPLVARNYVTKSKVFNNSSERLIIQIEQIDFIISFVLRTLENEKKEKKG